MSLSLKKNEKISLKKDNGTTLRELTLGLGWDEVVQKKRGLFGLGGGGAIDLDASIISFSASKQKLETVYYGNLKSRDGSILHRGDNLTGAGDGDDEQIVLNLDRISPDAHHLVCVITSYSGQTFDMIENVFCRVVDNENGKELVRYDLNESGKNTAQVMAVVSRNADGWEFKALGVPARGKTPSELVTPSSQLI